ncbi:hypothetical protein [Gryllotalpicola koreensis]|uniref:Phage FDXHR zinc binding domain-containing protein n=1 Tax=Gryllotalpicola koreensis TaxID=993086 RepID=A0ABP8A249_9MICO
MIVTHPRCGKSWAQHGNRTGHCSACCHTFEGTTLFDAHQTIQADGSVICREPTVMKFSGYGLIFKDGSWRSGKPFDSTVFVD